MRPVSTTREHFSRRISVSADLQHERGSVLQGQPHSVIVHTPNIKRTFGSGKNMGTPDVSPRQVLEMGPPYYCAVLVVAIDNSDLQRTCTHAERRQQQPHTLYTRQTRACTQPWLKLLFKSNTSRKLSVRNTGQNGQQDRKQSSTKQNRSTPTQERNDAAPELVT